MNEKYIEYMLDKYKNTTFYISSFNNVQSKKLLTQNIMYDILNKKNNY